MWWYSFCIDFKRTADATRCPYFIIKFWQHFVFKCETIMMRVQIETGCFQLRFWD